MQKIEIWYNPYKMETKIEVNGTDVCRTSDYVQFKEFIDTATPLQIWAGPVAYKNWRGIANELAGDEECFDKLDICFHGRKIDFDDLRRACEIENEKRKLKLEITCNHQDELSDRKMAQNIDVVMQTLLSDRFKQLVAERGEGSQVASDYKYLETHYKQTKDKEFKIVFAGLYSSGKSTILNTLIRHEILPMAGDTCTAKECRIKHNSKLKNKISLECFDEDDKVVVPKEIFDNDADCLNRFWEITPLGALESVPAEVSTIEICLDLSHLYPSKEMEKEFNLVIVDTPGCNSSKTVESGDGEEEGQTELQRYLNSSDKKIALDAITGGEKEMVIICADAQDYQDESIGDFLWAIHQSSEEDSGDFNDRFVFLLNKCDTLNYSKGETLESKKETFAEYIMNTKKWGITETANSPKFVPRIFMTCAYVSLAVQCGAANFIKAEIKEDKEKRDLLSEYNKFYEKVIDYSDQDYFLSQACDIPAYRKQEFARAFERYIGSGEEDKAVAIQTGIGCLEGAIRDYIERYAYPFKMRDLLNTFDALLADVTGFIEHEDRMLKDRMDNLGKDTFAREEVEKKKGEEEQRKNVLHLLSQKVADKKDAIDSIKFNSAKLRKTRENLHYAIESNQDIKKIRDESKKYSLEEIDGLLIKVDGIFSKAWNTAGSEFDELTDEYRAQLQKICMELKAIVEDMKNHQAEYDFYGYNFNSSLSVEKINRLDVNALRDRVNDTRETTKEKKKVKIPNPVKEKKYKKWQIFKRLIQALAPKKIKKEMDVEVDFYSANPIKTYLTSMLAEFDKLCTETEEDYKEDIGKMKAQAKEMADNLLSDITAAAQKIDEFRNQILSYGGNIQKLEAEIRRIQENKVWLQGLQDEIRV